MDKTLSLGIVFSALGAGAVTSALSTVTGGLGSIDKKLTESKVRIKALGLESVDAFARQKTELQKASAAAKKHQETTTQLGRAVALAKIEHQRASHALAAFQSELGKGSRRTAEQREKLRALKEELKASGRNLKGLTQEFTLARAKSERMKESVQQQTSALQKLRGALDQNGISTRRLAEHRLRITQVMRTEQTVLDRLTARYQKLRAAQTRYASARADLGSRWGEAMAAYGTARALRAPIGAFVRQDEALNALQVAMLDKNGQVHASYEGIKKQAIELGNLLPGTTADFINTARALMEQGVVYESVLHGGLRAASHLSVVLSMPSEQAGEMTAKLREAYKLTDNELPKMADLMQRGKFAFGMKPSDLMAAASYEAPVLNQLGISGLENANKMMAIQGIAAQVGLEGSSFGTNFSQMLSRLAKGPEMMEMAKKGMKGKAREIVEELGVTFEFFDDKGNFAGLDHMIKELEKLELIKNKAGQESALIVADALFGAEAGRPAMILAEQGLAGFQAARERMEQQAGLQQRIELITRSTSNTLEALGGSLENLGAALAGPVIQALHPLIHLLNVATGWLTTFAEAHPRVTKALGALALGLGAAASTFFTLGVVLSAGRVLVFGWKLFSTITGLSSGVAWLSGLLKGPLVAALGLARTSVIALSSSARAAGGGVLGLSRALGGALLSGLKMTGQAVLFLGRALFLNPVGLVITGIALGALLIYRYWRPIQGFFAGVWDGLKSGLAPVATVLRPAIAALGTAFGKLLDALGRLRPVLEIVFSPFLAVARLAIGAVRVLGGWLKELFTPVQDTGNAARQMGESFGQGIARALTWMGELLARFLSLPTRVIQAATDLANGIGTAFSGIGSFFTNAWDRIGTTFSDGLGKLTASIGNFSPLGLFQQAFSGVFDWCHRLPKSFADLGANLIDGLTSGITSKLTSVKDSMLSLGANARDWLAEKLGIHSPSTVFMSLGGDIGEGAALGILSSIPGVQSASGKLASAMMTGALAMTSAVGGTLPVNVQASAPVAIEQRIIPRIAAIPSAPAFHVPVQLPDLPETLRTLDPQITPRLGAMPRIAAMPSIPALSAPGSGIQESDPYPSAWRPQDSLIHDIQAAVQALPRTQGAEPSAPSAGDTIIHFSPNITIRGTGDAGEQAREALRLSVRELEQMLRRVEAERERRSY